MEKTMSKCLCCDWSRKTSSLYSIAHTLRYPLRSLCMHLSSWTWLSHLCDIERFHSRGQHLCQFIGTKESFYVRKEFNSHRVVLVHQHGRRFIVLEHLYGCRAVMWKRSIDHHRKYHNIPQCSFFVTPKFCISNVFSFFWSHFNSKEKMKTMFMQNFEVINKE